MRFIMAVFLFSIFLFSVESSYAKNKNSVIHSHNGRVHSHILPKAGIRHKHGNLAFGKAIYKKSNITRKTKNRATLHSHSGRVHSHILPKSGLNHSHGFLGRGKLILKQNNKETRHFSAIKPNDRLPFIVKGGFYEVLVNDLPIIFPHWKDFKENTGDTYRREYYKKLYKTLKSRNPINDARLAIKMQRIFLLSYTKKYRKNILGLPVLKKLGEKYRHKAVKYHVLQGVTNFEEIKYYEKLKKEYPKYSDEFLVYKHLVDHYMYYWNRTIIHAIMSNEI